MTLHHRRWCYLTLVFLILATSWKQNQRPPIPVWRFAESLRMRRYSDIAVPKSLGLSNHGTIINTRVRWLLVAAYDITYPDTVNVAGVKVGLQGNENIFFFKVIFFIPENELSNSVQAFLVFIFIYLFHKKWRIAGCRGSAVWWSTVTPSLGSRNN